MDPMKTMFLMVAIGIGHVIISVFIANVANRRHGNFIGWLFAFILLPVISHIFLVVFPYILADKKKKVSYIDPKTGKSDTQATELLHSLESRVEYDSVTPFDNVEDEDTTET